MNGQHRTQQQFNKSTENTISRALNRCHYLLLKHYTTAALSHMCCVLSVASQVFPQYHNCIDIFWMFLLANHQKRRRNGTPLLADI